MKTYSDLNIPERILMSSSFVMRREKYDFEISGGLGTLEEKAWRIGVMGYSTRRENMTLLLSALSRLLKR